MKTTTAFFIIILLPLFVFTSCTEKNETPANHHVDSTIKNPFNLDAEKEPVDSKANNAQIEKSTSEESPLEIEEGFPKPVAEQFSQFRLLVNENNKLAIAKLINYPLKRPNEVLQDEEEFIQYYDQIFDESLKRKLSEVKLGQRDFIIKSDHYGILGGKMWFSRHSGMITSLRYQTEKEIELAKLQKETIKARDHESIIGWEKAMIRCETENYTIYILQYPGYELNYVSWNKPKTSSDKPDLKLANGETKHKGTMGGTTYSFQNGIWTYAIDERRMGPDGTNGFFLQVFKNGELVKEEKAKKIFE